MFYTRSILSKKEGYPLFLPSPSNDLPTAARRTGTQIGDVGVLAQDGSFDPIFNILLPREATANRFGVPLGFQQLVLRPDDIRVYVPCYPAGYAISNVIVEKKHVDVGASLESSLRLLPIGAGAVVEVSTNSDQLALLLLPDGASSWDARSEKDFHEYAVKHGRSWYEFVNGDLRRMVRNGGIYLITGVTKSTSWCIAAVDNSSGGGKVALKLKAAQIAGAGASYTWEWENASSSVHSGPHRNPGEESWRDDQTVFIRGFKVALNSLTKTTKVLSIVRSRESEILKTTLPLFLSL
ncbi:hypothetical protein B0H11DRAFT_1717826 [Mycena galericulata]|nr:hypothetical protein B0H11DRAFT_1717826 [Mycena galericulata]